MQTRLDVPHDPADISDRDYSENARDALARAYFFARRGRFDESVDCLRPFIHSKMGTMQRIRMEYIFSLAAAHRQDYKEAAHFSDEAIDRTERLGDRKVYALLRYKGGIALHCQQRYFDAESYFRTALDDLVESQAPGEPLDAEFAFKLALNSANDNIMIGKHTAALFDLEVAESFLMQINPPTTEVLLRMAYINWSKALIYRWGESFDQALQHAKAALPVFERYESGAELARFRVCYAEILLDRIAPIGSIAPVGAHDYSVIQDQILYALMDAATAGNRSVESLAILTSARLLRLSRQGRDNQSSHNGIAGVEALARERNDFQLLSLAYTIYGEEAAAREDFAHAEVFYQRACDVLDASDAPIYSKWPRKGLRSLSALSY